MPIRTFNETIPLVAALFLEKLKHNEIITKIFDKNEKKQDGNKYSQDEYVKCFKSWIKKMIRVKGVNNDKEYKFGKGKNEGRIYPKQFGIQSLQNDIKSFLCKDLYLDFDMVNAQPTILLHLLTKHYPNFKSKYLKQYINRRRKFLKDTKRTKHDIIVMLFNDNYALYNGSHIDLIALNNEFINIKQLFWDNPPDEFKHVKKNNKEHKKGSFLSNILCIKENEILHEVLPLFNDDEISVPMLDGFLKIINKDKEIEEQEEETLSILNDATLNKYGVRWLRKPFNDKIKEMFKDEYERHLKQVEIAPPNYDDFEDKFSYDYIKEEFEKTKFMLLNPMCFCMVKNEKLMIFNNNEFTLLNKPLQVAEFNPQTLTRAKPQEFFKEWLQDENRRCYDEFTFIPNLEIDCGDNFNTFLGFKSKIIEESEWDVDGLNSFRSHISLLCGDNECYTKYFEDWIADLFQNTDTNPEVCICINSMKGVGKDVFYKYLDAMLGGGVCYEAESFNQVFGGDFNAGLINKVLVRVDEISGKEAIKFQEEIKTTMTCKQININQKNVKQYPQNNYIRWLLFSNNDNFMTMTADNRRFWVVKSGFKKDKPYYNKLFTNLKDKNILNTIFSYYKTRDIKYFNPREFPITEKMKQMIDHQVSPIYRWLYETFTNVEELKVRKYITKDNKSIHIGVVDLYKHYEKYLETNMLIHTHLTPKNFKSKLVNIQHEPITYSNSNKVAPLGKMNCKAYVVNIDLLIKNLDIIYKFGSEKIL